MQKKYYLKLINVVLTLELKGISSVHLFAEHDAFTL